jgi:hypothetical protein
MPTYCPTCDPGYMCCDFCKHYSFNGNEQGAYTGNGHCDLHKRPEDPGSFCDDYYCSFMESEDGEREEGYSDSTPTVVETPEGVETSLLEIRASSSQEGGS